MHRTGRARVGLTRGLMALGVVAGVFGLSVVYAHLCNNIYRTPSRFIIKPEKPITSVDKSEKIRVFVQNNFPVTIN